jgi:hypothetical protein
MNRIALISTVIVLFLIELQVEIYSATTSLELYGTFHSMGVIVVFDSSDDNNENASALVKYRLETEDYRAGYPLIRVDEGRFVGSIFGLESGKKYDVQITLSDPDGGSLDSVILTANAETRTEIVFPVTTSSYYVAPDGNDDATGDGSLQHPFATLTRALQEAMPGNTIVLREGVYHEGNIAPPRSGTENAPIVIQSYPGETAILDGADPDTFVWITVGNGVYKTSLNSPETHLIAVNGKRLYPYRTLSDLQYLSWGIPGFYVDNDEAYVHLENGADPNQASMTVSRFSTAFEVSVDYLYFSNLTFQHYGCGAYPKAIYINGGSDNIVEHCDFIMNDIGVALKRETHRNVIQHCTFSDTVFDWPWDAVKDGSGLETGGVYCYDPMTGRGNVIRWNTFHDYFDGINCNPSNSAAVTNETDIYENEVFRCGDDGIEVDGQSSNVRLWKNIFHDVLAGISVAPAYTGPTFAIRNLIYNIGAGNHSYSGLSFKFNSGYDKSGPMFLFHNTCHAGREGSDGLAIHSPGEWTFIHSRNNIWSGMNYAIANQNASQPIDFNYDNLYTERENELVWWEDLDDRHLETLEEVQTILGIELDGINVNPVFSDPASGDFTLKSGSPLIDKGLLIPGINDTFHGTAPDIGAFEYKQTSIPDYALY